MPSIVRSVTLLVLAGFLGATGFAQTTPLPAERAVENLAVFARAYGYVRFFHPSDAAAALDWDKFAVLGAERVRDAADDAALGAALRELFAPLGAGGLRIVDVSAPALAAPENRATPGERATYWQHHGVELSQQSNIYKSRRVIVEGETTRNPLFQTPPPPALVEKALGRGLRLQLPLVLPVAADDKTPAGDAAKLEELKTQLAALDLGKLTAEDWRLRVGGIVTTWNVFQHFHPYLDRAGIKWEEGLRPALRRTLADRTRLDYHATLSELVAKLQDGHGYVYGRAPLGGIPIGVAVIEDRMVVTGTEADLPLRKGDVLVSIDGTPALDAMRERERYVSGSPHLRRFRALNQFGEGPLDSVARIERLRDGERETVEIPRKRDRRGFFFNPIGEFEFPRIAEIKPGIYYVNLQTVSRAELAEKLPQLAAAKGVIFDQRWDGRPSSLKQEERVSPHQHVIPHLTDQTLQASPMLTPQVIRPDREGWTYRESTWPVQPKSPRFAGRIVFINVPPVVSYGETCMAMIADYHLATLVGAPTAGCNGNTNYILLPDGFRIMWTGMEVLKHDRSPFYGTGFVPDIPVERTIEAVKAGRDEYLEQAIAVIEKDPRSG